jgi:hypothetical protein
MLIRLVGPARRAVAMLPLVTSISFAQEAPRDSTRAIDLTVVDAPYNLAHGGRGPSMRQSLDLTVAQYELTHGVIEQAFGSRRMRARAATALFDLLSIGLVTLPLTDVWVHEEFHRAQMGRRGVGSFNDVYNFSPSATAIYVSHVRDEDIVRMKAEHPAEWVRVNSAGVEGELLMVRELQRRQFRGQSRGWHLPLYWLAKLSTQGYLSSSNWSESDVDTDSMNIADGTDVAKRDFTGHDLIAWTYDLHRASEPYSARGSHPSGVGINRYRKRSDLTDEERRWIRNEARLHWLNFVDPFLFGVYGVRVGGSETRPLVANLSLGHILTSFGHVIEAHLLLRRGEQSGIASVQLYQNGVRSFPGVEVQLFDRPTRIAGQTLEITPRIMLWMQPDGQAFRTSDSRPGGLASLRVRMPVRGRRLALFAEVEGKSAGWVAGSPYLEAGMGLRTGLTVR